MRYLGSKTKLLSSIEEVIMDNNVTGEIFLDLFAGTGCVGDYFKDRYKIVSNDFLFYSYILNYAKLKNSHVPEFKNFRSDNSKDIFEWLNSLSFIPDETYFFYENYTPKGGRMFFTEKNGIKIDGIRKTIEDLYINRIISKNEYYYLLASMVESITKISNTSGTYEAFFKFWDTRAEKDFELQPLEINNITLYGDNIICNKDSNELVREIKGDIAYIDPPYTVTQYISAYHILETLVKYDNPCIKGIGGKRERAGKNSLYAQKSKAKQKFEDLFRQVQCKHILISYSNQGLIPIDELCELAKCFAKENKIKIYNFDYREYQNHRSSNKGKRLNEVIIYFEKDLSINKSPINYSGSKDTLLPEMLKRLPENINVFVDVMGGAFNVGSNVYALSKIVYNEINPFIYEMIQYILKNDRKRIVMDVENIINKYGLKKGDKNSYEMLRAEYNKIKDPLMLFVLHMYSFQNMIRFNSKHQFNTPVGVAGYSEDMKQRILNFNVKTKEYELLNLDYVLLDWQSYPLGTVFYFDPPYYITNASYNDGRRGMKGWGLNEEVELLNTLKHIDSLGFKFILSNVIEHKGKVNTLLLEWISENNYRITEIGKSGWRYTKNEVLITNY